jgi:alpha-L-fucosidase
MKKVYHASWNSLKTHPTPRWLQDGKFGIYTHWGVYSVPASGHPVDWHPYKNVTWYPYNMYREGTQQYEYHVRTYGPPSQFGYKDFIPMFTAEKFDPDEWAELFKKAGARFAGPVGEHHDGFCMWDTQYSEWSAARMGPKRDVVGLLEKAIRGQGMPLLVALHHAENWWFFPHWRKQYDTSDPSYAGLYGEPHDFDYQPDLTKTGTDGWEEQTKPSQAFLESWKAKTLEVIDKYRPDLLWFDAGLKFVQEEYKKDVVAYYYNQAEEWGKEVALTYKWNDLVPGCGVVDLELGRFDTLTYQEWITDTTVDDEHGWGYLEDVRYKSLSTLIHYLIDNVSKNGYLLLNVGPNPDGEIPEQSREILLGMGNWLEINGEAIYGTTPWTTYGSGPTRLEKSGYFMEDKEVQYTAEDIRFTAKDDVLYAICLGWPTDPVLIEELKNLYPGEVRSISMLGVQQELEWSLTNAGLKIKPPVQKPCDHAYVFKIIRGHPFGDEDMA